MKIRRKYEMVGPEAWGLTIGPKSELIVGGCNTVELAGIYGTPLHVVDESRLHLTAGDFKEALLQQYPGKGQAYFAFKCNPVPGIIEIVKKAGLCAEVMSSYELFLAEKTGFNGDEIIVNGPFKTEGFLKECLKLRVRLIIVDSLFELDNLNRICREQKCRADILVRINPDYVPDGMNQGSATASRKGSPLGLDPQSGEVDMALKKLKEYKNIRFRGIHLHIGTGIHNPKDYGNALRKLKSLVEKILSAGEQIGIIDAGGGFGVPGSREMSSFELLRYQISGQLPPWQPFSNTLGPAGFIKAITSAIGSLFEPGNWPELILEPGRSVTSPNQILLLGIHQVKMRKGMSSWVVTDGGVGTVTMPTYYEFHQLFLCNQTDRKPLKKVTLTGPGCFAADVVYRNIPLPEVYPGETIAIMDSGAYFTSWESSFSHPLPAIVAVREGNHRLIRRRQSLEEMIDRDIMDKFNSSYHELCNK